MGSDGQSGGKLEKLCVGNGLGSDRDGTLQTNV